MKLPSYYLPSAELNIIQNKSDEIAKEISKTNPDLQIVGLGAGDGSKTKFLLKSFQKYFQNLEFVALDISDSVLKENREEIESEVPEMKYHNIAGNYFETFKQVENSIGRLVLFLGANIGNYTFEESVSFLKFIHSNLKPNDFALISFDLVKNPRRILAAYDDDQGITKAFNINLLKRMNHELGADFELEKFDHFPYYNPITGIMHSHIISLEKQKATIPGAGEFHFEAYEAIHTEISNKYFLKEINELVELCQFNLVQNYYDSNQEYVFSLLKPKN